VVKDQIRETLRNEGWPKSRSTNDEDQKNKALIPNVANNVNPHISYPKYMEYKVIHLGWNNNILSKCIRMNEIDQMITNENED